MAPPAWMLQQLWLFAAALLAGAALALAYDIYRRLLILRRPRRARRHYLLPDALFSLLAIIGLLLFWFMFTDGSLRFSAFIWMAAGAALYTRLIAPRLRPPESRPPRPAAEPAAPVAQAAEEQEPPLRSDWGKAWTKRTKRTKRKKRKKPAQPPLPQRLITRAAVLTWHGGSRAGAQAARLAARIKLRLRRPPQDAAPEAAETLAALPETPEAAPEAEKRGKGKKLLAQARHCLRRIKRGRKPPEKNL